MNFDLESLAAYLGATTGMAAFIWQVLDHFGRKPEITCKAYPVALLLDQNKAKLVLMFEICNRGSEPTTLHAVEMQADFTGGPPHATVSQEVRQPRLGNSPLPSRLEKNGMWTGYIDIENDRLSSFSKNPRAAIACSHSDIKLTFSLPNLADKK